VSRPNVATLGHTSSGLWVDVSRADDAQPRPGVVVLRPESSLIFANSDAVRDAVLAAVGPDTRGVVLDCETVPSIDVSAARMLGRLTRDLEARGIAFAMARDVGQVRDVLFATGSEAATHVHKTVREAVEAVAPFPDPPPAGGRPSQPS
jgi:SulP family sulfate permease